MSLHYYLADVFTDRPFGGNQLAVFPDASDIPEQLLLPIAREFNFSEVTFVYPAADARNTRRVRIFTPGGEIPFAGHPTVGTAFVLFASGELRAECGEVTVVLEEGVGPVPVRLRLPEGGALAPSFAQLSVAKLPEVVPPAPGVATLAEVLSLSSDDFLGGDYMPEAVSCGIPFLMVPLRSRDAVRRARVRLDAWERTLRGTAGSEMMVFALDPERPGTDVRARVFVPGLSVPEDPATGSASACLGGYLAARTPRDGALRWVSEQGVEMGRPSVIEIEADKTGGRITAVRVGGSSVLMGQGKLTL
jgi:trans-2,3-dihydro-3-hydroxyanthranilate isomerase